MMTKHTYLIIAFLLLVKPVFSQLSSDEIIAKHLGAIGLANAADEIKYYTIEGEILQNKLKFPIKIQAKIPDKFRMDMVFNNLSFVKISNGKDTWEYNPMNDTLVSTVSKETEAQDFIDRWTGGLYNYNKRGLKAKLIGIAKVEDIDAYKLELTFDKTTRIYFIDKLSFLILRIDDDTLENKITYYRDFRKTGNYLLPFSMVGYEGGVPAISMQFKTVVFNPTISDSSFDKPSSE